MPMLDDPENLSEKAARAWESVTEKDVAGEASQVWTHTKEKAGDVLQSGGRYVSEHPGTSVLGVFGAGLVIGALVAWAIANDQRDEATDSIHRFLARLGRRLNLD